jgi:hypothetical protein
VTDTIVPYFSDKLRPPNERAVLAALGRAASAFEKLFEQLQAEHPDMSRTYRYYADAKGWLLKVTRRSQTVFWLNMGAGRFRVTFYFPERLTAVLRASELSEERKSQLRKPATGKLRSVSITFGPQRGLRDVMTLVALKRTLK